MDPSSVFRVVNVLPLPVWALWMVAPSSGLSRTVARSLWPFAILGGLYVTFIAVTFTAGAPEGAGFGSLEGVMRFFDSEWGTVAGWTHYLCFDLFVARWIMNDAPDAGYWLTPILLLTLMFGPAGLLCYLAVRGPLGFDR
jgi:hypothetical protein